MRAVLQRVLKASVVIKGEMVCQTGPGLLVFLGVGKEDGEQDSRYLAEKAAHLRIFENGDGKMSLSCLDEKKEVLVVSQFTLYGDARHGRRPDFQDAAAPDKAKSLYELFVKELESKGLTVKTGVFGEKMEVQTVNSGPVTVLLDSKKMF